MLDELCSGLAPRKPDDEFVAETKQLVVPAAVDVRERQVRKVRVLFAQQQMDERLVDLEISDGFAWHGFV